LNLFTFDDTTNFKIDSSMLTHSSFYQRELRCLFGFFP
jgi:hypothetical protein